VYKCITTSRRNEGQPRKRQNKPESGLHSAAADVDDNDDVNELYKLVFYFCAECLQVCSLSSDICHTASDIRAVVIIPTKIT
jgi:hypothetical protein